MTILFLWPDRHTVEEISLPPEQELRRDFLRILLCARRVAPFARLTNGDLIMIDENGPYSARQFTELPGVTFPVPGRAAIVGDDGCGFPTSCATTLTAIDGVSYIDRTSYYVRLMRGDYQVRFPPLSVRRICEVIPFPSTASNDVRVEQPIKPSGSKSRV